MLKIGLATSLVKLPFSQAQQNVVRNAERVGRIDLKQYDQIRAVQQIVDLIAVKPLIVSDSRLKHHFKMS